MSLTYLYRNEEWQILWFHGSSTLFPEVLKVIDRRTYFIYSFSWYISYDKQVELVDLFLKSLSFHEDKYTDQAKILFLLNSNEEHEYFRRIESGFNSAIVNNSCFLSTDLYSIGSDEKKFDAVCNSKPKSFKRHALSSLVENKIFITYGAPGTFESSSLRSFNPLEIFTNIPAKDVAALLNKSMVGLILSEEEGACYASTEYLLCGLPVVSTKSRGGRDEYYTEENSVVVDPKAEAVRDAVALLCARLRNGELSPARIREGAVRKTTEFRENFLLNLRHLLQEEANAEAVVTEISRLMTRYSKMGPLRNWFRKTV